MARILGVDIPKDKRIVIALTYVFGIGKSTSQKILAQAQVSEETKVKELSDQEINAIRVAASKYKHEGDLRREIAFNIKRLTEINSYRGLRHRRKMPVRGQRTKNNCRTRKGPRKIVANKKIAK